MQFLLGYHVFFALLVAAINLYRYGNIPRQHPLVSLSVFTAWTLSLLMVLLIPLDVTMAVYRQCLHDINTTNSIIFNNNETDQQKCPNPMLNVQDNVFPNFWRIIYWTSQFLTWLIMPMMQSYLKAGDFKMKGKLKAALIDNMIYYGSYLLICVILLIYLTLKPDVHLDWPKLKAIASSASNTWGLFLLVLLLGYALVEVPRSLLNHSRPGYTLQRAYFKLAKLSSEKAEAEENVEDILESLRAASRAVPSNHEFRLYVETIMRKVPVELSEKLLKIPNHFDDSSMAVIPSEKALIRLHKQVIKSLQTFQRTEALWNVQVAKVIFYEDVVHSASSMDRSFKSEFFRPQSYIEKLSCYPVLIWYIYCFFKSPFLKCLAIVTALFSFMVVWSELTFFNRSPVLSIFALMINNAKSEYNLFSIELISLVFLGYLSYCAFTTILKVKFFNLYYLAPHHQTNEHSLIFSGMLVCRLAPPLCLNFLGMIHMDSHIIKKSVFETYFTQVMGHMDVISIISDGFNIYFPMLMLAFCLATWFSLGSRALNALGFQQFMLNETIALELVQEGRDLIAREKRRRQRAEESIMRRRDQSRNPTNISGGNNYYSKFRSNRSNNILGPEDGLLRETEPIDYSTNRSDIDISRSLSQEINDRFGASTQMHVGFKGYDIPAESDSDSTTQQKRTGPPPKGIFDDV